MGTQIQKMDAVLSARRNKDLNATIIQEDSQLAISLISASIHTTLFLISDYLRE